MSKTNISLDQANAWIKKVENEIAESQKVMNKALECVKEYESSDDTIYQNLNETVKSYESAWGHLTQAYKDVFAGLRALFKSQAEAVEQAVEAVKAEGRKAKM